VRRIERRMAINQIHDLSDYVRFLESYPIELNRLHKDLLIGVTNFFRDTDAFLALANDHLPNLLQEASDRKLRLWVAGCSTGEEAYTLAILCNEAMEHSGLQCDIKIFATDVDREAILEASNGMFAESAVADIDPPLISKYFYRKEEGFQVSRQIREMVVFAQHNLIKDPPFTNIDLISCRNLLIYLQPVLQRRVLELFNFGLNNQGILFLGSSETIGDLTEYFESLNPKWRIYRSRGRRRHADLHGPSTAYDAERWRNAAHLGGRANIRRFHEEERMLERLLEGLSGDYLPFCMVVNESMELMQVVGDSHSYLQFPAGKVINDVSKLTHKDLTIPLTTGLQKVFKQRDELSYSNIHLRHGNDSQVVNMRLKPLPTKKGQIALIAVLIEPDRKQPMSTEAQTESYDIGREAEQRITDLEGELQFTRENLQATVEELETSNEELQATNEELLASNEELQSTNEELQSVNEELYTVNAEYQGKITELTEVNNDLDNLLSNSGQATLFIDENLDLRRFTPEAARLLNITEHDMGRALVELKPHIPHVDLLSAAHLIQTTERPYFEELQTADGERHLLRAYPYQIAPDTYAGIIMTFINISGLRHVEDALSIRTKRMNTLLQVIPDGYVLSDESGRILEVNPAMEKLLGYAQDEMVGKNVTLLMPDEAAAQHDAYIARYLAEGDPRIIGKCRHVEAQHKDGRIIPMDLSIAVMEDSGSHWFVGLFRLMPQHRTTAAD
jgi:two-component system CheB/CheR fusion protein